MLLRHQNARGLLLQGLFELEHHAQSCVALQQMQFERRDSGCRVQSRHGALALAQQTGLRSANCSLQCEQRFEGNEKVNERPVSESSISAWSEFFYGKYFCTSRISPSPVSSSDRV
jgi:hypothetical protein